MTATEIPLSKRLIAMLRYAKTEAPDLRWQAVARVLADLYYPEMTLFDSIRHLVAALEEVLADPRFEVGRSDIAMLDLLLAPIKGCHAIDLMGPKALDTTYSVDQFYNAMASYIWGQLRISRVDWCVTQLQPQITSC